MPITGAIFDCDGTIVDSMPMWRYVPDRLLARYGARMTPEVFEATEPLNCDDECLWFHEHLGVGESGEALYGELRAMIREEYRTVIQAFPGVRAFLDELAQAGIPMVVASSTPADDLRVALAAHGLEGYFKDIIFTGDVGRGKEHPDVYLHALGVLGTDRASTWVFEDAPFGVKTAHDAGFPTVCLVNDHDGRDESWLRRHADILVHGYDELSLALLEDWAPEPSETSGTLRALVVDGSPEPSSPALVARLAAEADYVIAADRGAGACHAAGVTPDMYCGDDDSADADLVAWARESAGRALRFPQEKYATDLALAIDCARHEAARQAKALELTVTCATGGRPDHALAVFGQLARAADASPRLVEDGFSCRVLSPEGASSWQLGSDAVGRTFSAIPLVPESVVTERGMRWELDEFELGALDDRAISNIVTAPDAVIRCHRGVVAAFLHAN